MGGVGKLVWDVGDWRVVEFAVVIDGRADGC
jgi:hypothetical protein